MWDFEELNNFMKSVFVIYEHISEFTIKRQIKDISKRKRENQLMRNIEQSINLIIYENIITC